MFVDQLADASPPSGTAVITIDGFGQPFQRCRGVHGVLASAHGRSWVRAHHGDVRRGEVVASA